MRPQKESSVRLLLLVGIGLFLTAGCKKNDPLDEIVDARTPFSLMMWKGKVSHDFTSAQWHDFDEAVQELKFEVMTAREATGTEAIQETALQKMDGGSVRSVLRAGFGFRLKRLLNEEQELKALIEHNKKLKTRKDDEASKSYLANIKSQQDRRLRILGQQIEDTKAILRRSGISATVPPNRQN